MSTSKHFPGPYEFYQEHLTGIRIPCPETCPNNGTHQYHDLITPQHMGPKVASVLNVNNRQQYLTTWQLMAASPEMLDALKHLIIAYIQVGGFGDPEATGAYMKALKAATTAIGEEGVQEWIAEANGDGR